MAFLKVLAGRRHRQRALRRIAAWTIAVLLCGNGLAFADYRESYQEGIKAMDRKNTDWNEVANHMRDAIRDNPQSGGTVKIYGNRFELYVPYYYLGQALFEVGRVAEAADAFKTAASYGMVKGKQRRELDRMQAECQARLPSVAPPPPVRPPPIRPPPPPELAVDRMTLTHASTQADEQLKAAERVAQELTRRRSQSGYDEVFRSHTDLARELTQTMAQVATAEKALRDARTEQDLSAIENAGKLAAAAAAKLTVLQGRTESLHGELMARREREEELKREQEALATVDAPDGETSPGTTASEIALQPPVSVPPPPPTPPGTGEPPPILRQAAEAFFSADYQKVLATLADISLPTAKARATAHLLSAAARYALFLEEGKSDENLRHIAAADVTACRRLDSSVAPDSRYFAPPFVDFFESVR